jgi:hypothetical protein
MLGRPYSNMYSWALLEHMQKGEAEEYILLLTLREAQP